MVKLNTENSYTDVDSEVKLARITIFTSRECAGRSPPCFTSKLPEIADEIAALALPGTSGMKRSANRTS
jgi:hypothetical protein